MGCSVIPIAVEIGQPSLLIQVFTCHLFLKQDVQSHTARKYRNPAQSVKAAVFASHFIKPFSCAGKARLAVAGDWWGGGVSMWIATPAVGVAAAAETRVRGCSPAPRGLLLLPVTFQ